MSDKSNGQRSHWIRLLTVSVLFGLAGLLVMWAKLYVLVPGFNMTTDAREAFVLLSAVVTGPIGGLISGILSSLADPPPGVSWFPILDHALGGFLVGWLSVRFISPRSRNVSRVLSWSVIVFMYYYIFPIFTLLILSTASPESYLKLVPGSAPFLVSVSRLMMGWTAEFVLTLVITSAALISLPKGILTLAHDSSSPSSKQGGTRSDGRWSLSAGWPGGISIRLMLWFLLLSVLPLIVASVFIQENVAQSFLLAEAGKQRETARFLANDIVHDGINTAFQEMRDQKKGSSQFFFVVDQTGKYVVHLDSSKVGMSMADDFPEETVASVLKGPSGIAADRAGERAIGYAPIVGTDLRAVSAQGKDALAHALNNLQNTINIKLGSTLLIISLVWGVVIWIIVGRPMRRLTHAAQEVAHGNLQVSVNPEEMEAEIAVLAETFNEMTANLGVVHRDMEWEIAHRKTTEGTLREREKQFRLLAENSTDLISRHDLQGRYRYASPAGRTLLGYEPEELIGRLAYDFVHPGDVAAVSEYHQRQMERETAQPIVFRMRRKDGSVIWFESTSRLVVDPTTGQAVEIHASSRDVTQRLVAELALKESEERLRSIVSNVPVVLYSLNKEGVFTLSEGKGLEKLGLKPGQVVGLSVFQVYGDFPEIISVNRAALAGESSNSTQEVGALAFDTWISPIKDATGEVTGVIGVAVDVTDRKRAEEAVRESERMHKKLIEQSSDPIYVVQDNRLVFVNRSWEETFGYSSSEAMGESFDLLSIVAPENKAIVEERLSRYSSGASTAPRYELRALRRDGEFIDLDVSVARIEWKGKPAILGIYRDITERKRSEEALRQSQKTESLGILAGGIAHDFNNLLQAMLGQISLSLSRLPKNALAYGNISKAEGVAQRAAELTRQLLAYSGRGNFDVRPLDLNSLIRENLHFLELAIPKNIALKEELTSGLPLINADAGQIQQVVMNLIINASEAIGENPGRIQLRTSVQEITANRIGQWTQATGALNPGEFVQLEVADSGLGMTQETLHKIFDPFFTTKVTGRGLGLSAVIGIVKGHHGGLRVESEAGHGTTFLVAFPASGEKNSGAVSAAKDAQPVRHEGCILIVDDEPDVREVLADMMKDVGIKPLLAEDGERGYELYKEKWQEIDLVLLDLSMPGIGGKETFKRLKGINKNAKVIMTSGYSESEVAHELKALGLSGFIQKPYSVDKLMDVILAHLDKK